MDETHGHDHQHHRRQRINPQRPAGRKITRGEPREQRDDIRVFVVQAHLNKQPNRQQRRQNHGARGEQLCISVAQTLVCETGNDRRDQR